MIRRQLSFSHASYATLALLLIFGTTFGRGRSFASRSGQNGMVLIEGGTFIPFAKVNGRSVEAIVRSFYIDAHPVTNREYLEFVRANPEWRRSQVKAIFADVSYLRSWSGDLAPGPKAPAGAPVTYVSWYAARAYCAWRGKRLPTLNE
ncbi:MAG: formylglycine-generating enzyme family protein, partial [Bacteroidetes bacterium]|nr:formylglycine-generating enzyme family protein [Bacteroidota bacterium]